MSHAHHLRSFTQLASAETMEERASLWREGIATLARVALDQQPVPLEGLDVCRLLQAVRVAQTTGLLNDLTWLSPPGAAAAVYELAAAIPDGPERRRLARQVLTRLHAGNAETFVVLARCLAAESRRTLTGGPIRARVALSLSMPTGSACADALALTLLSRPDLRREWLTDPSAGSLPSRRLAARLLERAAREAARRASQGDAGSLRVFQESPVQVAWRLLLADRESLVWRHVAVARGLLAPAVRGLAEEIEDHLRPELSPTEWRRAAVSVAASVAVDPVGASGRCRALLRGPLPRADPGLAGVMMFGFSQALEAEPDAVEELIDEIVRAGGLLAAEALVELRRERLGAVGQDAARFCRERLQGTLKAGVFTDDGQIALCQALVEELVPGGAGGQVPTLRGQLDAALQVFVDEDASSAFRAAQRVLEAVVQRLGELEQNGDDEGARRKGFRTLRELDMTLLESSALSDLLLIGAGGNQESAITAPLGNVFERLTNWLLRMEGGPLPRCDQIPHLAVHLRRLRTLLHVVDADGSYGGDLAGQRRQRRTRTLRTLLARIQQDGTSPLRRTLLASLARTCDALLRDDVCELSDVMVVVADHLHRGSDLRVLAEASMMVDVQRCSLAYARLVEQTSGVSPGGASARKAIDGLSEFAQALPWGGTLRVSAMRRALLELRAEIESIAEHRSLPVLMHGAGRAALGRLQHIVFQLARLAAGSRQRLLVREAQCSPVSGQALSCLEAAFEQRLRGRADRVDAASASVARTLKTELPLGIANAVQLVLDRAALLPVIDLKSGVNSFTPPAAAEAPLPPWMPVRRTLGDFYVQRALGNGGVGSVFVVVRADERQRPGAMRFALKVPDYSAEAARTLSEKEFLQLFRQEAGALLAIPHHPNLAGFVTFDAGVRPKPILVMELVEGPTLEWALQREELTMPEALAMLDGIGAGLQSMHSVGIGHLDIKPSNVILRRAVGARSGHGVRPTVPVLVDFGLSGRHIRPGCATGPYGAPEIWGLSPDAHEPQPMAADIYAYACVIFETLTGQTLFDGPGELAIINAHLVHDGYPQKLLHLRSQQPHLEILCDLIANGLRQHPGERISVPQMRLGLRELCPGLWRMPWPVEVAAA